jgi:two-component system nitrate/nitrite response regulator NarP
LVADDHPILISGIKAVLRDSGFDVVATADSGTAALELLESVYPEILLLDISMPQQTGLDVLRCVRGSGNKVKIVLLTGSMHVQEAVEALDLSVDGIILKENGHSQLITCLHSVAGGAQWVDEDVMRHVREFKSSPSAYGPGAKLTPREEEVAHLVAKGMHNKSIAHELGISDGTVKVYLSRIYEKLGLSSRTELALLVQEGSSRSRVVSSGSSSKTDEEPH